MEKIKIIEKINGKPVGFKKVHNDIEFFKSNGTPIKDGDLTKDNKFSNFIEYVNENMKDELDDESFVIGKLITDDINYIINIEKDILNSFIVYNSNVDKQYLAEHFEIINPFYESDEISKEDKEFLESLGKEPIPNDEWTEKIKEYFDVDEDYQNIFNDSEFEGIVAVINDESFIIENPKIKNIRLQKDKESFKPDEIDMAKERKIYKDLVLNIDTVEFTNNPKENIKRYLTAIINKVKESELIDEDILEDYRLNPDEFFKVGLEDIYASAKGTKSENIIYFFLNLLRDEKPEQKHIISKDDNEKINFLRKKFNFDTLFEYKKRKSFIGQIIKEYLYTNLQEKKDHIINKIPYA